MFTSKSFERNQSILWARDVLGRSEQFYIAYTATKGTSVHFSSIDGRVKFALSLTEAAALRSKLVNYEVLYAGLPEVFIQAFKANAIRIHDTVGHFESFVSDKVKSTDQPSGEGTAIWIRDVITMMASSKLQLDQANTDTGQWTGSHFKPSASVFDKLRNFIKP